MVKVIVRKIQKNKKNKYSIYNIQYYVLCNTNNHDW